MQHRLQLQNVGKTSPSGHCCLSGHAARVRRNSSAAGPGVRAGVRGRAPELVCGTLRAGDAGSPGPPTLSPGLAGHTSMVDCSCVWRMYDCAKRNSASACASTASRARPSAQTTCCLCTRSDVEPSHVPGRRSVQSTLAVRVCADGHHCLHAVLLCRAVAAHPGPVAQRRAPLNTTDAPPPAHRRGTARSALT
jgi:hypothetical protein